MFDSVLKNLLEGRLKVLQTVKTFDPYDYPLQIVGP